ncbi:CehA/McbA family metallohydrolase [Halopelagius longus]|uniref:PHP domain-containing protein n=1 Tax=Halopelagius longus TaxID=1236180 RepID=A0A1H0XZS9_9EURY|nr:PHP domain-containing protein [Halopelagius longus]RDI72187.1 PHP domain-containing protein [Halopelagius longus]SDQ08186.1 Predicted metal-dependent phosphoesterase TrpH, contains PHP domain [Halopelagius longus]
MTKLGVPDGGDGASDGVGEVSDGDGTGDADDADGERREGGGSLFGRYRTLRFDPHVHSEGSYDCETPVEAILERAAAAGLDAVAVTDHDEIDESLRAAELAPVYGLVGIPGVEVSTAEGHLLALGVESVPETGRSLAETARRVADAGGVSVVPHPFQRSRHGARRRAIDGAAVDAVEVYNAHTLTGLRNGQARSYADARSIPGVGGSDAHGPALVGRAYTVVGVPRGKEADPEAVLDAVAAGRTAVRGERTTARQYLEKYATNASILTASIL